MTYFWWGFSLFPCDSAAVQWWNFKHIDTFVVFLPIKNVARKKIGIKRRRKNIRLNDFPINWICLFSFFFVWSTSKCFGIWTMFQLITIFDFYICVFYHLFWWHTFAIAYANVHTHWSSLKAISSYLEQRWLFGLYWFECSGIHWLNSPFAGRKHVRTHAPSNTRTYTQYVSVIKIELPVKNLCVNKSRNESHSD